LRRLRWSGIYDLDERARASCGGVSGCLFPCLLPLNDFLRLLFFSIGCACLGETFEADRTDDIGYNIAWDGNVRRNTKI
jgi:hypothetical protein